MQVWPETTGSRGFISNGRIKGLDRLWASGGTSWKKCITGDVPVKDILALAAFCFSSSLPGHREVSTFLLPHPAAMVFLPTLSLKAKEPAVHSWGPRK